MVKDVAAYVESNLERGLDIEIIKQNLLGQGHSDYDIDKAINEAEMKKNGEEIPSNEEVDSE